tara:strand:- start:120 stop:1040 length:921 start_codon:yes stop_codon:yes gene_type:complete
MTEETAVVEETVEAVVEETPQLSEDAQQFFRDKGIIQDEPVEEVSEETAPEEDAEVVAEEAEPQKEEPKVSKIFSEVAKKKRELFKQEQELKEKNDDLGKLREAQTLIEEGKHLEASELLGSSYESMTDQVLNRSSEKTALQKMQEEISQLKKEKFEADKQKQKELASQEVQSYVSELKSMVDESEKYPLVSAFWDEAQQSILDIQKHYAVNGGETLTNEEVLDQVEKTYRDFMDNAVQNEKVRSIYKIGSPSEKPLGEVQKSQSRTLSQKGTSRLRTSETKTGPLSKHEALERAVNVFRESKAGV